MKKIISLMLVLLIAVFACGCGADNSTPTGAVEAFLDAAKDVDVETMNELMDGDEDDLKEAEEAMEEDEFALTEALLGKLEYEVVDEDIDDDEAVVTVEVYPIEDAQKIMAAAMTGITDEDEYMDAMLEALEDAEISEDPVEVEITLEEKGDAWIVPESALSKVTSAMMGR